MLASRLCTFVALAARSAEPEVRLRAGALTTHQLLSWPFLYDIRKQDNNTPEVDSKGLEGSMSENENAGGVNLSTDNHVYKAWLDEWEAWLNYVSVPCNCDGRPVWERPILDYSEWIREE